MTRDSIEPNAPFAGQFAGQFRVPRPCFKDLKASGTTVGSLSPICWTRAEPFAIK